MKKVTRIAIVAGVMAGAALADTHYVNVSNPTPSTPYSNWATAAQQIQQAVDAATAGDTVLVTNGIYDAGGALTPGSTASTTSRVVITKTIVVKSVNGPQGTVIGGEGTMRGAYLSSGAAFAGFTITNGRTKSSGSYTDVSGGGMFLDGGGIASNCVVNGNSAYSGGGVYCYQGTVQNSTLNGNSASSGGGAYSYYGTLQNCTLIGNTAAQNGGGAYCYQGTLIDCTLTRNSANSGGGVSCHSSTVKNCSLSANNAESYGGGADCYRGTLVNCTLSGNSAMYGGGTYCVYRDTLRNCILWGNTPANWIVFSGGFTNCCTTPLLPGGNNITSDPLLASASHIAVNSPCIGAGAYAYTSGVDIDGQTWKNPPSIGCDEVYAAALTGTLRVAISAACTVAVAGAALDFLADIQGVPSSNLWTFGDGSASPSKAVASHAWSTAGSYRVVLRAFNGSYPSGVAATVGVSIITLDSSTLYVNRANPAPVYPYDSWSTAATNIQDAVDAQAIVGGLVLVTNGVYDTGGALTPGSTAWTTSRVVIAKAILVKSVNGPQGTVISGAGAMRGAYLLSGATLAGFTITNGRTKSSGSYTDVSGGGLFLDGGGIASNCVVNGNNAYEYGGGAYCNYGGTLNNCVLCGNTARVGGGTGCDYGGTLQNCVLNGNTADFGGGAYCIGGGILQNCVLNWNTASEGGGVDCKGGTVRNCLFNGNSASRGGGAYCSYGTVQGSALCKNTASEQGGGVYILGDSMLQNCTLSGNSCFGQGGGMFASPFYNGEGLNCIIWNNTAPSGGNWYAGTYTNCCTTPSPPGANNIISDPLLVNASHIAVNSPCIGAGAYAYASGVDIDGQTWKNPPSIGCDEVYAAALTGMLRVAIGAAGTAAVVGTALDFDADIQGFASSNRWTFGDGSSLVDKASVSHAWNATGAFSVVLRAFNSTSPQGVAATVGVSIIALEASTRFASKANPTPSYPYASWATAATNIQDAIDAQTIFGGLVLVTNGTYDTGGRLSPDLTSRLTNRIVITTPIVVRSMNGPRDTIIRGWRPQGQWGPGAVRGVYVSAGALVSGFTITNGSTLTAASSFDGRGGGILFYQGGTASNCIIAGNTGYGNGGGAYCLGGTLVDCMISQNTASNAGGGVYSSYGTIRSCTFSGSSAYSGGGAYCYGGVLQNCTFNGNNAYYGGAAYCYYAYTVWNSTLSGNNAYYGGGVYCYSAGTLQNCTFSVNNAYCGGGAYCENGGSFQNCALFGNTAESAAGVAFDFVDYEDTLRNCTLVGNKARSGYGGLGSAIDARVVNCILYDNTAPSYPNYGYYIDRWSNCCSYPMPTGIANITNYPHFASASHIAVSSPCIGRGSSSYATGVDIDGQAWKNPPSIGCDEVYAGALTGALKVAIIAPKTAALVGIQLDFLADIQGMPVSNSWKFGDGTSLANQIVPSHAWSSTGNYLVVLKAFNATYPQGVAATVAVTIATYDQSTRYVDRANATPAYPYGNWTTAATNIQDAVDAAVVGGLVLVSNGVYDTGGALTPYSVANTRSRVVVAYPLTLRSVSGPDTTIIQGCGSDAGNGVGAVRVVYLCNNAALVGFTVTNGGTQTSGSTWDTCGGGIFLDGGGLVSNCVVTRNNAYESGGGAYCYDSGTLENCVMSGNSAQWNGGGAYCESGGTLQNCILFGNSAANGGGGASRGLLQECLLIGNSAANGGGGTYYSTLQNATLRENSANYGGGAYGGTLVNCIVWENMAINGGGFAGYGTLQNCALYGNVAEEEGGGVDCKESFDMTLLQNCTLTGNKAKVNGGGIQGIVNDPYPRAAAAIVNSVVYDNVAPSNPNWDSGNWTNCCTIPLPSGSGNITNDPQLVNASHIAAISPCVGAGDSTYASGVDIDDQLWKDPPSIGCDELYANALTGVLSVAIIPSFTVVVVNTELEFMACIAGMAASNLWSVDGGEQMANKAVVRHAWGVTGSYIVVLKAFNIDYPYGVAATAVVAVGVAPFVDITNQNVFVPYGTTSVSVAGTNNAYVVGGMWWSNDLTGVSGSITNYELRFTISNVPLGVGTNVISVYGTNVLGMIASDSVVIVRDRDREPPVIEPDALVFPGTNGAVLEAGVATAIIWRVGGIWDNADSTNLMLPSIAILATNSGGEVALVGTNVANLAGMLAWTPWGLESATTAYVVRIEAVDIVGNWTNRIFTSNVFTIVPEPAGLLPLLLCALCCARSASRPGTR